MIKIAYPAPSFKIKTEKGKQLIFDEIRKQWIRLTPEEWVRQNFIQYLVQVKRFPATLIAIEKQLELPELKKRFDILVYDGNHQPFMMVECKAMQEQLNQEVLDQLLRYNVAIPVPYLVITNGTYCYGFERRNLTLEVLVDIPSPRELT